MSMLHDRLRDSDDVTSTENQGDDIEAENDAVEDVLLEAWSEPNQYRG